MKLFENGIGRPSNEIKKKRKIFITSMIGLVIALIAIVSFLLFGFNEKHLKGATHDGAGFIASVTNSQIGFTGCQLTVPLRVKGSGYEVTIKDVKLSYRDVNANLGIVYPNIKIAKRSSEKTYKLNYDLKKLSSTEKYYTLVMAYTTSLSETKLLKYEQITLDKNVLDAIKVCQRPVVTIKCDAAKANKEFKCTATSGAKIVADSKNLASNYKNEGTGSIKLKYTKAGSYTISASKKNYNGKSINITVAEADKPNNTKKLTLDCPSSAKTGEWFKCTTNKGLKDVKITADSNGFSGNKIEFTTSLTDNVKDLRYSTAGKKIITATYGKQKVTKTVEVKAASSNTQKPAETKPAETKTASLKSMKISCQDAVANKAFTCTVKDSNNKKLTKAAIKVNTSKDLAKNYKTSSKGSLKLKYTKSKKVELIAKLDGYKTKKITVNIAKAPTTTTKKQTSTSSSIASYNINYSIPKVTKTGNNGEKKIEFKITNVGKNVKYYKHIICFERDACIGENGDESRYKGMTSLKGAKVGATSSVDIITVNNAALLNQDFYVRVETYDKDSKRIYYKTHHFYVNPTTSSTSKNKNVSDEARVQIDDFAGTTHDFLFSKESDKVKSTYQVNYGIPSIKKLSELDIDGGVKKSVNIAMHDFGENVKYVSFVVCMKKNYCLRPNVIDYVSQDPYRGSVLPYQIPEHGKEIPIEITTEDEEMLNQKIYVRIYSYDTNKKLLFSKLHEFTTGKATKLGVKKESEIKVGDRVISEVTKAIKSEKYK